MENTDISAYNFHLLATKGVGFNNPMPTDCTVLTTYDKRETQAHDKRETQAQKRRDAIVWKIKKRKALRNKFIIWAGTIICLLASLAVSIFIAYLIYATCHVSMGFVFGVLPFVPTLYFHGFLIISFESEPAYVHFTHKGNRY